MQQVRETIEIATNGQGLVDLTDRIAGWVRDHPISDGLLTIFCPHTSASLLLQENASPEVKSDVLDFFADLVPEGPDLYRHEDEGMDDMPAHLRTALTQSSLSIPLVGGRPTLGTWQAIYLFEHRRRPHTRSLVLYLIGE